MNEDFRVKISFVRNIKTHKMIMEYGEGSVFWLLKIWAYASENCTNGVFEGFTDEDIESLVNLPMEIRGKFVKSLNNIGFMDCIDGTYSLHDWEEHNPWASQEDTRKDLYRLNSLSRHMPEIYNLLNNNGIVGISKEQLRQIKEAKNPISEAKKLFGLIGKKQSDANAENSTCNGICNSNAKNNAIAPPLTNTLTTTNTHTYLNPPNPPQREKPRKAKEGCEKTERQETQNPEKAEEPDFEFMQLREMYDEHARPEGPMTGWIEYKAIKAGRKWPGICQISHDIMQRIDGNFWNKGYEPSLARYLKERMWEQPIKTRATPQAQADNQPPKTFAELEADRDARIWEERIRRAREYDLEQERKQKEQGNEARAV